MSTPASTRIFPANRVRDYAQQLQSQATAGEVHGLLAIEDHGADGLHVKTRGSVETDDGRVVLIMLQLIVEAMMNAPSQVAGS